MVITLVSRQAIIHRLHLPQSQTQTQVWTRQVKPFICSRSLVCHAKPTKSSSTTDLIVNHFNFISSFILDG
jgi:hypothetical protein